MKSLFAVLVTAFFVSIMIGCEPADPSADAALTPNAQGDVASVDAGTLNEDALVSIDLVSGNDEGQQAPEESEGHEELPSDPTENPGEASYYEFPAWHIPPQG